ncbi:MAG TPA: trypsin-like peptidase domain-containing protein [Terracidiphilus sp.]|nr:trypsin-like peptidase domain-containing protein [Terracidiphilus sp.]
MKNISITLSMIAVVCVASAQVAAPKRESRLHHIFTTHRDNDNLPRRFNDLRCALVLIQAGPRLGTGFYIDPEGDIVTASHVLGNRLFNQLPDGKMQIMLQGIPFVFMMKDAAGQYPVPLAQVDGNVDNWAYDLAILHSNRPTKCWLRIGDDKLARVGEHLVTLGFPGLAFGSLALYTGILSSRLQAEIIIGTTLQGTPLKPSNDYLRVQMPISPGISGAPIIDDENRVIGIVTTAGVWRQDLEQLTEFQRMRDSQPSQMPPGTIDLAAATAHLASILHDFASPGYGDAVPVSYLQMKRPPSPQKR